MAGHSILKVEAGALANRLEGEPYIDLCGDCVERFQDWLRSGQQNGHVATVGPPAAVLEGLATARPTNLLHREGAFGEKQI